MYCRMHRKTHCTLTLLQWSIEMVDSLAKGACLLGQKKQPIQETSPLQKKIVKHTTYEEASPKCFDRAATAAETILYKTSDNYEYIPNKGSDVFETCY